MHGSVDGLGEDGASRADLKLLSRTLKELRHAFRFFDGLRARPKVSVFGSARLPAGFLPVPDHFERGGSRTGDPRLLPGVTQHANCGVDRPTRWTGRRWSLTETDAIVDGGARVPSVCAPATCPGGLVPGGSASRQVTFFVFWARPDNFRLAGPPPVARVEAEGP